MANMKNLNKLASNDSTWKEEAERRKENRGWQEKSQRIAVKILSTIREKGIKQKQLAVMIGVSPQQINKIVKGNENLTLTTITKLENALNLQLIFNENNTYSFINEYSFKKIQFILDIKKITQQKYNYTQESEVYLENMLSEKVVNYGRKHKNISIEFKLRKISTEQFIVFPDAFNKSNSKIEMNIGLKFGLDNENKILISFVKVLFEQKNKAFIVIEVANYFDIEEKTWANLNKTENNLIIPKAFASNLVMFTIGTLRGVLHCKTENSDFKNFIFPEINVAELIKNDVELN